MRIILLAFFTILGANLVIKSIDKADKIQQEKMHQLCQIDQSYCTSKPVSITVIPYYSQWTITLNQNTRTSMKKSY